MFSESVPAPESLQQQIDALARRLEKSEKEHRAVSEENRALREKSKRDDATIQRLEREFQEVRRRLEQFIRAHYGGAKSESISPKQLELALQGMAALLRAREVPASVDQAALPENKVERPARERRPRARHWTTNGWNNARR